jgi:hypothetical protein
LHERNNPLVLSKHSPQYFCEGSILDKPGTHVFKILVYRRLFISNSNFPFALEYNTMLSIQRYISTLITLFYEILLEAKQQNRRMPSLTWMDSILMTI